jgi:hypothetical protein
VIRRLILRCALSFAVLAFGAFCTRLTFGTADAHAGFGAVTARSLVRADPGLVSGSTNSDDAPAFRVLGGRGGGALTTDPPVVGTVGPPETRLALVGLDAGGHNGYGVFLAYVPGRARHVAALAGGDVAKFADGGVVVFAKIYDPQSPECCPRTYHATRYTWNGMTLVAGPTRVVPASAVGGR